MKYIKINKDTFIEYNEETQVSTTILKNVIENELSQAKQRLQEIPQDVTDAELLAWARDNMPRTDYSAEKEQLEQIIFKNTQLLNELI